MIGTCVLEQEAEAFLDKVLGNQGLFLEESDAIIQDWVVAPGSPFDVFDLMR